MPDLLTTWAAPEFAATITEWASAQLDDDTALLEVFTPHRTRFWSAVYRAESTQGTLWCKVNNPGQSFEARVAAHLAHTPAKDHTTNPIAADPAQGLLLYPDYGPTLHDHATTTGAPQPDTIALAHAIADFQHDTSAQRGDLLSEGLPSLTAQQAPDLIATRLAWHVSLPAHDQQHLNATQAAHITALLPEFAADMATLANSDIPGALQPNDTHSKNAYPDTTAVNGIRLHDFADAFWSHPFAVLDSLLARINENPLDNPNTPNVTTNPIVTAYLSHWDNATTDLVMPALRLGRLHRYESWRRLVAQVPYHEPHYDVPTISTDLLAALTRSPHPQST